MDASRNRRVLRWDPYLEPNEDDMEFRLTYAGRLLATRNDRTAVKRSLHKHEVRKAFHRQLKRLWSEHPVLLRIQSAPHVDRPSAATNVFDKEGFIWKPIVTKDNGLVCALDTLMLRSGQPADTLHDIDNRLKTVFDALRMPGSARELGEGTPEGKQGPGPDEEPFYVLLEDDRLITHLAVTTDMLLEPVPDVPQDESVRLILNVTVRAYTTTMDNLDFS